MKKRKINGIMGAILGGFIALIPWLLVYIYGNIIFSFLTILIVYGALKGYIFFHGKEEKDLPWILFFVSIFWVSIAIFLIIPLLFLYKEGDKISILNLKTLYASKEFRSLLFKNYKIAILFLLLGMSGMLTTILLKKSSK